MKTLQQLLIVTAIGGLCCTNLCAQQVDAKSGDKPSLVERAQRFAEMLRRPGRHERLNATVRGAFQDVIKDVSPATVRIVADGRYVALGSIIDKDGYVLTKHSEVNGDLQCKLQSGVLVEAEVIGFDADYDLAMLKIDKLDKTEDLPVVRWSQDEPPALGSWLATPSLSKLPISVGVVSAASRRIPLPRALLGIGLAEGDDGPRIDKILPGGAAAKSGLKESDIVVKVNGVKIRTIKNLQDNIMNRRPGTIVEVEVVRDGDARKVRVKLGRMSDAIQTMQRMAFQKQLGGPISERREDFPSVLQHDSVLRPQDCGGPIVNLDGEVVGVNIARASRISSFALPSKLILPVIEELRNGKGGEILKRRRELAGKKDVLQKSVEELQERVRQHTLVKKTAAATIKRLEKDLKEKDDADKRGLLDAAKKKVAIAEQERLAAEEEVKQARSQVEKVVSELTSLGG